MPDGDERRHNLQNKLDARAQGVRVVHHTHSHNNAAAQQNAPQLPVHIGEGQHGHHKAHKNRQAAQPGDGVVMHPALVLGYVHRADFHCQPFHHRRQGKAQGQGHHQGEDYREDACPIKYTAHVFAAPAYLAAKPIFL